MTTMHTTSGMTMRQYYKAAALQGLLAAGGRREIAERLAELSGVLADAMIAEDAAFERQDDA